MLWGFCHWAMYLAELWWHGCWSLNKKLRKGYMCELTRLWCILKRLSPTQSEWNASKATERIWNKFAETLQTCHLLFVPPCLEYELLHSSDSDKCSAVEKSLHKTKISSIHNMSLQCCLKQIAWSGWEWLLCAVSKNIIVLSWDHAL